MSTPAPASVPAPAPAPTRAQLTLADSIRRALTEAAFDYGQRTGLPGARYLETTAKSEINAVIARVLAEAGK